MSLVALLHLAFSLRWFLHVGYMLSVTFYMLLAIRIFLSETCYYLQKLVPFARCCTSRNFWLDKIFGLKKMLVGFFLLFLFLLWYGSLPPELSQKPMSSLCVKFQPSSTPPSDRFWWGVLLLLVLLVFLLVTGVKKVNS